MKTSCTHCGAMFEVPDKTLGKQARCKSCGKLFVLTPAGAEADVPLREVEPPRKGGSTSRLQPIARHEEIADPMADLADAAIESGAYLHPVRSESRRRDEREIRQPRRRMARGASLSLALGIIALVLPGVGALPGMMAVVYGNGAHRQIRKSREMMDGRGQATAGVVMGWASVAILLLGIVIGAVWLSKSGGIVFQETVGPEGKNTPNTTAPDGTPGQPPAE